MCINYRLLYANIKAHIFSILRINDLLNKLAMAKLFIKLDLAGDYH